MLLSHMKKFKLIVSPRGELSKRAINSSNKFLKIVFIHIIKFFNKNVIYHATSQNEQANILDNLNSVK